MIFWTPHSKVCHLRYHGTKISWHRMTSGLMTPRLRWPAVASSGRSGLCHRPVTPIVAIDKTAGLRRHAAPRHTAEKPALWLW